MKAHWGTAQQKGEGKKDRNISGVPNTRQPQHSPQEVLMKKLKKVSKGKKKPPKER